LAGLIGRSSLGGSEQIAWTVAPGADNAPDFGREAGDQFARLVVVVGDFFIRELVAQAQALAEAHRPGKRAAAPACGFPFAPDRQVLRRALCREIGQHIPRRAVTRARGFAVTARQLPGRSGCLKRPFGEIPGGVLAGR
jgi:hypothetical protein